MPEQFEEEVSPERGTNVHIDIRFIRHGEKTPEGMLTDYGREVTRQKAHEHDIKLEDFDAVKAVGSTAGPKGPLGMERSLETAHIYAIEVAKDKAFATRPRKVLDYERIVSAPPFNWTEFYNANLPSNFSELSDEEKARASKTAEKATLNHLLYLKTPLAEKYKKERAGSFAYFIDYYQRFAKHLKSGSKVLLPAGTHGGMVEVFLQQALVRRFEDGSEVIGFKDIEEIGGAFDLSESFTIRIATNKNGNLERLNLVFDDPKRPKFLEIYLDQNKLKELKRYYEELHKKEAELKDNSKEVS